MAKISFFFIILCIFGAIFSSVGESAISGQSFALKFGYNFFQSDIGWRDEELLGNDASYFNGHNFSLEWNIYFHPSFSLRMTIEQYSKSQQVETYYSNASGSYYSERNRSLTIIPFTFSARYTFPLPIIKPYVYGGFGLYYWSISDSYNNYYDYDGQSIREGDEPGLLIGTGFEILVLPKMYLKFEFENRFFTINYLYDGHNYDLNADAIVFNFGLVFNFRNGDFW